MVKTKKRKINRILKTFWNGKIDGFDSLYEKQKICIEKILNKQSVSEVMATGSGKSICFQLPALYWYLESGKKDLTIIIAPITALINDQVKQLNSSVIDSGEQVAIGLTGEFLVHSKKAAKISEEIIQGKYGLIYVLPTVLKSVNFLRLMRGIQDRVRFVTVDESHCLSMWGHSFQEDYLYVIDLIRNLPKKPVVAAFTATATQYIKTDVENILELKLENDSQEGIYKKEEFIRSNLNLYMIKCTGFTVSSTGREVSEERFSKWKIMEIIQPRLKKNEQGIIFCSSKYNISEISGFLMKHKIKCAIYHGGMTTKEKNKNQEMFEREKNPVSIMVATNAYGMGVNKSNINFVIHYNMPLNIENYYQEVGRAARTTDMEGDCYLFYKNSDNEFLLSLVRQGKQSEKYKTLAKYRLKDMIELVERNAIDAMKFNVKQDVENRSQIINEEIFNYFTKRVGKEEKRILSTSMEAPLSLYVNRTYVANEIRKGYMVAGYKGQEPLKFRGTPYSVKYCVEGKLDYYDLLLADAVYSLWLVGKKIYIKSIFSVLSGGGEVSLKAKKREKIENRLEKMMKATIKIVPDEDDEYGVLYGEEDANRVYEGFFLPMKKVSGRYSVTEVPPLYQYAEVENQFHIFSEYALKLDLEDAIRKSNKQKTTYPMSEENLILKHFLLRRIDNLPRPGHENKAEALRKKREKPTDGPKGRIRKNVLSNKISFYDQNGQFFGEKLGICTSLENEENGIDPKYKYKVFRKQEQIKDKIIEMIELFIRKGFIYGYDIIEESSKRIAVVLEAYSKADKEKYAIESHQ